MCQMSLHGALWHGSAAERKGSEVKEEVLTLNLNRRVKVRESIAVLTSLLFLSLKSWKRSQLSSNNGLKVKLCRKKVSPFEL
jgi:hypothetical protein